MTSSFSFFFRLTLVPIPKAFQDKLEGIGGGIQGLIFSKFPFFVKSIDNELKLEEGTISKKCEGGVEETLKEWVEGSERRGVKWDMSFHWEDGEEVEDWMDWSVKEGGKNGNSKGGERREGEGEEEDEEDLDLDFDLDLDLRLDLGTWNLVPSNLSTLKSLGTRRIQRLELVGTKDGEEVDVRGGDGEETGDEEEDGENDEDLVEE